MVPNDAGPSVYPTCMLFNNSLKQLIVGLSSGYIEIFSAITMTKTQEHERLSENKFCQQLIMSGDERYIAARDNGCVTLFKYGRYSEAVEKESWYFNGRLKSHDQDVTSIAFFNYKEGDSIKSYLFSIGKDKYMVRYDIYQSSETKGLKDDKYLKIELESIPTSIFFYPEEIEGDPFMALHSNRPQMPKPSSAAMTAPFTKWLSLLASITSSASRSAGEPMRFRGNMFTSFWPCSVCQ